MHLQSDRGVRTCERTTRKCSRHQSSDSPAAHVKDCGEAAVSLQPTEIYREANNHLQPMEDSMPKQVGAQRRLRPFGKPTLKQVGCRTCGPVGRGSHAGAVYS